eukprot:g3653.t1
MQSYSKIAFKRRACTEINHRPVIHRGKDFAKVVSKLALQYSQNSEIFLWDAALAITINSIAHGTIMHRQFEYGCWGETDFRDIVSIFRKDLFTSESGELSAYSRLKRVTAWLKIQNFILRWCVKPTKAPLIECSLGLQQLLCSNSADVIARNDLIIRCFWLLETLRVYCIRRDLNFTFTQKEETYVRNFAKFAHVESEKMMNRADSYGFGKALQVLVARTFPNYEHGNAEEDLDWAIVESTGELTSRCMLTLSPIDIKNDEKWIHRCPSCFREASGFINSSAISWLPSCFVKEKITCVVCSVAMIRLEKGV